MKKKLFWTLGGVVVLAMVAIVVLPHLVDAESYRGLLRSNLERQLGRPVEFGAMDVSLWPVLGLRLDDLTLGRAATERFDEPLKAESLRVGARLFPLLRGKLKVTSLTVEGGRLSLYRNEDRVWEPILAPASGREARPVSQQSDESLTIERLKIRRSQVVVRAIDSGQLRETALENLTLDLKGIGTGGPVAFELATSCDTLARLRMKGTLDPAGVSQPQRVLARIVLESVSPATLRAWMPLLAPSTTLPDELLADRPFLASARVEYTGGRAGVVVITDATLKGIGLHLVRSSSGVWNLDAIARTEDAEPEVEPPPHTEFRISDATVEDAWIRVEDRSSPREPAVVELSGLRLKATRARPDAPVEIDLQSAFGVDRRGDARGQWSYEPAIGTRPATLRGRIDVTGIDPRDLRLAETLASLPRGLIVGRASALSAEMEATLVQPPILVLRNVELRDLDLAFGGDSSGQGTTARAASASTSGSTPQLAIERIELTNGSIRVTDRGPGTGPAPLELTALRISLDRLPTAGPAALELDAEVGPGKGARLSVRGELGPVGADPSETPLDLAVKLDAIPLSVVQSLLPVPPKLDLTAASASADVRLNGTFARAMTVRGEVRSAGAKVSLVSPRGDSREWVVDLGARGEVALRDSGDLVDLTQLNLELPRVGGTDRMLTIRGSVNASSDPPSVDVELLPTRVAADDLAALAAIVAPDAPLSFASPEAVELELRARGPLGGGTLPDLDGRATLSGLAFRFVGMTQPMEKVGARLTFSSDRLALEDLGGVIGKSEVVASRVLVTNFSAPRVQLDINAPNADFWELFSFVEASDPPPGPKRSPASGADPPSLVTVEGKLRIAKGSLQTLTFEDLTAGVDYRTGVLTLAPLEMNLYGGRFAGELVQDLNTGVLTIDGNGSEIDADKFLAQNMALGGVIAGRATTDLDVKVRSTDPANLIAGVSGGGPLQLVDGRLEKLQILSSLAKVAGVFGEGSLRRLTRQLATAGTPFKRAETRLSFDAGVLAFKDLAIETPELSLAGNAALETATGKLEGRFAVAFSPELSATMREEQSRAARVFWDPKTQRVSFGFDVQGPATSPAIRIDWETALLSAAGQKLGDKLNEMIGRTPETPRPSTPPAELTPSTSDADSSDPGLAVEITRTRWTGPALLRNLSLEGHVRGTGLDRVSLQVVDARGIVLEKVERLRAVEEQLANSTDRDARENLAWSFEIAGKRLVVAGFPITVTAGVHDLQGNSVFTTRELQR